MDQHKPGDRDPSNKHRVYIRGLDLAAILRALYNRARPKGDGRTITPSDVTLKETRECLRYGGVDYLKGRAIKVSWSEDWISLQTFHEYNGAEEGYYAIEEVIKGGCRVIWTMKVVPE